MVFAISSSRRAPLSFAAAGLARRTIRSGVSSNTARRLFSSSLPSRFCARTALTRRSFLLSPATPARFCARCKSAVSEATDCSSSARSASFSRYAASTAVMS